jgi:hypothetical protein
MVLYVSASAVDRQELASIYADRLATDLGLDSSQAATVRSTIELRITEVREAGMGGPPNPRQGRLQLQPAEQSVRDDLATLLSEEQLGRLDSLRLRILPQRRLLELNDRLDLTAEQVDKIDIILAVHRDRVESLRMNQSGRPNEHMETMRRMSEEADSQIEDLLDNEQKKEFKKMNEEREKEMRERRPRRGDRGGFGGRRP